MIIKEYRIPMPMTPEEYNIAWLFTTLEMAKLETGGGDGVEDIISQPFKNQDLGSLGIQSGQYTLKKLHLDHKVPSIFRLLTPRGSLYLQEECWNAFPYCKTVMTNDYLGERLCITVETILLPDKGHTDNALRLSPEQLHLREVIFLDIAKTLPPSEESCIDAGLLNGATSKKTGRGPLIPNWFKDHMPIMTAYKVVTLDLKLPLLQSRLEAYILGMQRHFFTNLHRKMFLLMDQWYGLTMKDIRRLEEQTAQDLDKLRKCPEVRGLRSD